MFLRCGVYLAGFFLLLQALELPLNAQVLQLPPWSFYFTGNGLDSIGEGQSHTITPVTYNLFMTNNTYNGLSLEFITGSFLNWDVDFASANGSILTPGLYLNATRYPFNFSADPASNGIGFEGGGAGYNADLGEFLVLQANYSSSGIVSFAADFIQEGDGDPNARNFGSIRINSDIPLDTPATVPETLAVPEPSYTFFFTVGLFFLAVRSSFLKVRACKSSCIKSILGYADQRAVASTYAPSSGPHGLGGSDLT